MKLQILYQSHCGLTYISATVRDELERFFLKFGKIVLGLKSKVWNVLIVFCGGRPPLFDQNHVATQ